MFGLLAFFRQTNMVLDVEVNAECVKKLEKFLTTNKYKELAENAMSFNRKLNEERKMRIPYVDGQVGVALVVIYFNYIVQFSTANPAA